jgi:CubicO group peptidase (beta-lactamase class C family)
MPENVRSHLSPGAPVGGVLSCAERTKAHAGAAAKPKSSAELLSVLFIRLLAMLAAVGVGVAGFAGTAAATPPVDTGQIDDFLQQQLQRHRLPGMALGLVDGDRIVHVRGFGTADSTGRPVGAQTPFVLASVSKPLTATAVMQLVDAGKVQLDAPVQHYLPQFQVADPVASSQITVRQLLNHTSGLPASACQRETATLEQFLASMRTVKLDRPVGTRHVYCSGNYNILGLMVQRVSREPFGEYVRHHIFAPLGMRHSYTAQAPARQDGLAQGHRWLFGVMEPMDYYNPSGVPSGYLISTAEDMTHFLIAQQNGGVYQGHRLLSAAAVAQMQQPAVNAGQGSSYGLGWSQGKIGDVAAVYHFGANYDVETLVMMEPGNGRGAVILINAQGLLAVDAFRSIESGLARMLNGEIPTSAPAPMPTVYGLVDTILIALTSLALLPALRLAHWARTTAPRRRRQRLGRRVAARIVIEMGSGLLILAAVGFFTNQLGATWYEMALLIPDFLPWLWAISAVIILTGLTRALIARHAWATARTTHTVSLRHAAEKHLHRLLPSTPRGTR